MFLQEKYVYSLGRAREPIWRHLIMSFLHLGIKQPNFLLSFKSSPRTTRCTLPRVLSLSRAPSFSEVTQYSAGRRRGNAESQRTLTVARVLCQIEFQDLHDRERWMLVGMCTACPPAISNFGSVELTKCSTRRSRN